MKREKILKAVLIIFIIIILAFFVNLGRKTAILISIENKREKINEIDNIYYKTTELDDDNVTVREIYRKGDIVKEIVKEDNENKIEIIIIENPEEVKMYVTSGENEKSLFIYKKKDSNYINEYVEKHTFIENARYAMNSKITTRNYNGEKCYVIEGKYTPYSREYQDTISTVVYVSKATGIKVKFSNSANVMARKSTRRSRVWSNK